jgi:hypothetical protein
MAQTSRGNPDVVLRRAVKLLSGEVARLQAQANLAAACPACGIDPGLTREERQFVAQVARDLGKLALDARKQVSADLLRKLSDGGLQALSEVGKGKTAWLPE